MSTSAILRHRRDTAANFTSTNPVLQAGQLGFETDTRKSKLGDGTTAWNSLSYTVASPVSHTHTASDVTDFNESVDDRVNSLLVAGSNVTLTYNDTANTLTIASTGGGGSLSDGDKGDITVSSSGSVWTIDNGVVGTAKLGGDITTAGKALLDDADAAAQRTTLGLGTAATTNSTDYTAASHVGAGGTVHATATTSVAGFLSASDKTKLDGIASNANNYVHPNHTGDVTSTGDGATVIANDAVTNAKLANVATSTIKGRATAGSGDPEDLTASQVRTIINVADGATANSSDSTLLNRANHTGTQAFSTITGTVPVNQGGTNITSYTANNYIRAQSATVLEQRTPAQVLSDIGAAATSHTHTASQITDFNSASRAQTEAALVAGSNITITPAGTGATRTLTIASTGGGGNTFSTIAVSGQSNVVADSTSDTLTLTAGSNVTITTDASTDTITIAAATGGSPSFGNGSASSPALSPTTDPNTGFYFDGSDRILVAVGGSAFGGWNTARSEFEIGTQIGWVPTNQALWSSTANYNSFGQAVLQNFNAGTSASTDLVIANDSGTETTNYLDLGLNSTGYTDNFFGSARDGYLYVTGGAAGEGNLWLGTQQSTTKVRIAVGGGSATNIVCDFDTNGINLPAKTGTVTAPAAGLNLFNRARGGRNTLRMLGPAGVESALQPALFGNSVSLWLPGTGTTVAINFGTAWTARNSGTGAAQAHPARASTNAMTSLQRATFGTGTTATGSSGIQTTGTIVWRGNAAGLGGFFFHSRFGIETYETALQVMVGLSALNAALTGDPSAQNNSILMCKDAADTTWQIVTRGTAPTKTNTGITCAAGDIFDFFIFAAPNGSSVAVQILNAVTGESLYESTNITTNLPTSTTFMYAHAQIRSTVGTTAKLLALNRIYVETDL